MTAIGYLNGELGGKGDFASEYRRLSPEEIQELQDDAKREMLARGIDTQ